MRRFSVAGVIALAALWCSLGSTAVQADPGDVIAISPGGPITAATSGRLTISQPLWTVTCNVSLNGSLATSTVQSSSTTSIGAITSGTWNACTSGVAVLLFPSAWSIELVLPLPTSGVNVRLRNVGLQLTVAGTTCLYGGSLGATAGDVTLSSGSTLTFTRAPLPRVSGSALLCGTALTFSGSMSLSPSQTITLS